MLLSSHFYDERVYFKNIEVDFLIKWPKWHRAISSRISSSRDSRLFNKTLVKKRARDEFVQKFIIDKFVLEIFRRDNANRAGNPGAKRPRA